MQYRILVDGYEEANDTFNCRYLMGESTEAYKCTIPAFLMPVIASDACAEAEDLPYDLVGMTFEVSGC